MDDPIGRRAASPLAPDRRSATRLDVRNRVAGRLLRLMNPLVRGMVAAGAPTGPTCS